MEDADTRLKEMLCDNSTVKNKRRKRRTVTALEACLSTHPKLPHHDKNDDEIDEAALQVGVWAEAK